jgi:SIR2-like domain
VNVKECVLLTGAGFTRNFGAPLAADVWALLFSHPDVGRQPKVRNLLQNEFDFEHVYHEIMTGNFDSHDRAAMSKAVGDAYDYIDSILQNYNLNREAPNIYGVQKFLNAFAGDQRSPGFIFTLNQDLFMERHFYNGIRPALPYIPPGRDWFTSTFSGTSPLENQAVISDGISPSMSGIGADPFYYIKLHGSSNWVHSGGTRPMIIGRGKETQIAADILLSFYAELFRNVLVGAAKRLLCIGYSFRDPHVNEVIADAVHSGTEIFILGPGSPEQTACHLQQCHRGTELWNGLAGYFPFDLVTLFPADQRITQEWKVVSYRLFGRAIL